MIGLVDYDAGNLLSARRGLEAAGATVHLVREPSDLAACRAVVLPGVGAFGAGIAALRARRLDRALVAAVEQGTPLLGICLGMQLLFETSHELGEHRGLGLIPGVVEPLPEGVQVPDMGWHRLRVVHPDPILPEPIYAYFAHSYAVRGDLDDVVATIDHGGPLAAVVRKGAVVGCQFHPEKSGADGLALLRRFVEAA